VRGGTTVRLREPGAVRSWAHVLDVLHGYLLLAQALAADPAAHSAPVNLPGHEAPVRAIAAGLNARFGVEAAVCEGDAGDAGPALDGTRARDRLGWAPQWSLDEALDATVDWYRADAAGDDTDALAAAQLDAFAAVGVRA